jgi:hypothetical protein
MGKNDLVHQTIFSKKRPLPINLEVVFFLENQKKFEIG